MKLSRQLLKQLIAEEKAKLNEQCGVMPSQGLMVGHEMEQGPAVQHPSYAGSGDMSMADDHSDQEGQMALSQLQQIMKNADMLKGIVSEDDELQSWVQSKLTKASDYLDSVRGFLEYEMMPNRAQAIALQEGNLSFSKNQLKQVVAEELARLEEARGIRGLRQGYQLGREYGLAPKGMEWSTYETRPGINAPHDMGGYSPHARATRRSADQPLTIGGRQRKLTPSERIGRFAGSVASAGERGGLRAGSGTESSSAVTGHTEYGNPLDVDGETVNEIKGSELKRIVAEELASLSEYGLAPGASLGDEGQPSPQDVLRSSIMDAIDLLKAGNTEDALGTLEATLDAYTGSGELDSAVQDEG